MKKKKETMAEKWMRKASDQGDFRLINEAGELLQSEDTDCLDDRFYEVYTFEDGSKIRMESIFELLD